MIKKAFIITLLFASVGRTAAERGPSISLPPCLTCSQSYVNSSLIGSLAAKNGKEKDHEKTPVQIAAKQTQRILKLSPQATRATNTGLSHKPWQNVKPGTPQDPDRPLSGRTNPADTLMDPLGSFHVGNALAAQRDFRQKMQGR